MGLTLQTQHFASVSRKPKLITIGVCLQLLLLPLLAWLWIIILALPAHLAAGLILIALAPGGATSNIISFLAKGDVALSVCLTAVVSLIVPFTLPLLVNIQFSWLGINTDQFSLPLGLTIMQLLAVTVAPVLLGMLLRHYFNKTVRLLLPCLQPLISLAFIALIIAMAHANQQALPSVFSLITAAVLLMCCSALMFAYGVSSLLKLDRPQASSITIEVGIQNAGTAMMVAATLLNKPELAMIPLLYGIAMNLPALLFIGIRRLQQAPNKPQPLS